MTKYPFRGNGYGMVVPQKNHQGIIIKDRHSFMENDSCGQEVESNVEHMIEFNIDILLEFFPELKENIENAYRGILINDFLRKICSSIYGIEITKSKK